MCTITYLFLFKDWTQVHHVPEVSPVLNLSTCWNNKQTWVLDQVEVFQEAASLVARLWGGGWWRLCAVLHRQLRLNWGWPSPRTQHCPLDPEHYPLEHWTLNTVHFPGSTTHCPLPPEHYPLSHYPPLSSVLSSTLHWMHLLALQETPMCTLPVSAEDTLMLSF